MASILVHAPVKGYSGLSAGVLFVDGVGEVDPSNTSALRYFHRKGYRIEQPSQPVSVAPHVDRVERSLEPPVERPKRSASQAAWAAYAIARGGDPAEVQAATRRRLIDQYGG